MLGNERTAFRDNPAESFIKRAFGHFFQERVKFSSPFSVMSVAYCSSMAFLKLTVTIIPNGTFLNGHETILYEGYYDYTTFIFGLMIA